MKRYILNWWTLTIAAAVIVALILAVGLPIFMFGLRPWWMRLLLAMLTALVWGGFALYRLLTAQRASDAIAEGLAETASGDRETDTLAARMSSALSMLRESSGRQRDYLYSRPWYVIIGPPGAGKTTALLNSGLRFPFADSALKGVGGTRNLDFWFADEAVLVDTAGRYTTQDSDTAADAGAWRGFLTLLRKHRPLEPINGVIVAIGLDRLIAADRAELDADATIVRRRLAELRQSLELDVPIYLMFTKADLLSGFAEFYDDLDVEGRRAVLGVTLPREAAPDAQAVTAAFDNLAQAVADRGAKRLQDEVDARRRSLILGFPAQFAELRARIVRFMDGAFLSEAGGRKDLRGFYFTSGVQDGAPLDRILGGVAEVFDQQRSRASGPGRAYFLNRVLNEVVIAEAGMVDQDPNARARRKAVLTAGLAAIAGVAVLTLLLWTISFAQNRGLQNRMLTAARAAQSQAQQAGLDLIEVRSETDPDLEQSLPVLQSLRNLPRGFAEQGKTKRPLFMTFGLYQSGLEKEAKEAYLSGLRRIMLPRILLRLERFQGEHPSDQLPLYEGLKTYLMLGGRGPLDVGAVKAWVTTDWASSSLAGADRQDVRNQLSQHLDAMLADKNLSAAWPSRTAPLSRSVIDASQSRLQGITVAQRAFAILSSEAQGQGPDWRIGVAISPADAHAFANPDAVMQLSVPFFFTADGYRKVYIPGLPTVGDQVRKERWVLGPYADTTSYAAQVDSMRADIATQYAKTYNDSWDAVAKTLQPANYFHDPDAMGIITRDHSPLTQVLLEVLKNTTYPSGAAPGSNDAGQQIDDHFKDIHDWVGDGKSATSSKLIIFLNAMKAEQSANGVQTLLGANPTGASQTLNVATATQNVKDAAAGAPAVLSGFVAAASAGGVSAATASEKGAVAASYEQDLLPSCQMATDQKYPFFGASPTDASIADMQKVFGLNGQFDTFTRDKLGGLLDTHTPEWSWNANDPVGHDLNASSAEVFWRAAKLQELLTSGLVMKVEAIGFGGAVNAADFSVADKTYRFDSSSPGPRQYVWMLAGAVPEAHVSLYSAASGATPLRTISQPGVWALFRLMDKARIENAGPLTIKASFGDGAAVATFRITLTTDTIPFRRSGVWSLRCPKSL